MLRDPERYGLMHGIAYEYENDRYGHSITVEFTGEEAGDFVERQVQDSAEAALSRSSPSATEFFPYFSITCDEKRKTLLSTPPRRRI